MDSIITYLLIYNQYLIKIIYQLIGFIAQHIPLKQMQFDDSNSPKYQKFKVDKLPIIKRFEQVDYKLLDCQHFLIHFLFGHICKSILNWSHIV